MAQNGSREPVWGRFGPFHDHHCANTCANTSSSVQTLGVLTPTPAVQTPTLIPRFLCKRENEHPDVTSLNVKSALNDLAHPRMLAHVRFLFLAEVCVVALVVQSKFGSVLATLLVLA